MPLEGALQECFSWLGRYRVSDTEFEANGGAERQLGDFLSPVAQPRTRFENPLNDGTCAEWCQGFWGCLQGAGGRGASSWHAMCHERRKHRRVGNKDG